MNIANFSIDILLIPIQVVIFGAVIYYAVKKSRERESFLKRLAESFGVKLPAFSFYPSLKAVFNGRPFTLNLIPESKNSPAHIQISYFKEGFIKIKIYRESVFSEAGKRMGLVREVKTGDNAFDKEFLIFSDKMDQAQAYFYHTKTKDTVRELFNIGFRSIICDNKKVFLDKPVNSLENDLDPSKFKEILTKVDYISQRL
ncbi:MAG TPA: hypothetical protein PLU24_06000 [Candidatus Omnitrophota bacterium]|nr:hypothetical protein [Candidatus Omnitrophota bacterium]